jgi:tetratricopeptide (TPR) repeat protein
MGSGGEKGNKDIVNRSLNGMTGKKARIIMFSFLTLISVSGIFSSLFGKNNKKAKEHFEQARVFFDQKKYNEAIVEYKAAIANNPRFDDAYVECADAFLMTKDLKNAKSFLRSAIKINPENAKAHNNLGCCYHELGDYEQAEIEYEIAARLDPKYFPNVGSTKTDRPMKVVTNFSKDKTLLGDTYDNQGVELQKQKQYQEAIILHKKAIDCGTSYPQITYNNLGKAYDKIGDYKKAISYYDEALKIEPDYALAIRNRELAIRKLSGN